MNRILKPVTFAFGLATVLPLAAPAIAQSELPSREEVNPAVPQQEVRKGSATVDDNRAFDAGPCPLAESDVRVAIREVRFTAPGGGELAPELATRLAGIGTSAEQQPIRVVCDLRDQANMRLRSARYVASVQIPPQRIEDGVLRLEVISGRITEVRVRGDAGPFENLIKDRIEQLKALTPLNAEAAERILLLADDVPGLNVQLGLSPDTSGGRPGDLVGELTVDFRRYSVVGNVQNYNSKQLGRESIYLRSELYGLLGSGDRTFFALSSTFDFEEQRIAQVGQSITLNGAGDRLSITATYAESRPDLETIDLRTRSLIGNIEFQHTVTRSVNETVDAALGFEWAQQRTRVFGAAGSVPLSRDRISTFYARASADRRKLNFDGSQAWQLGGFLEVRQGVGILGSTKTGAISGGYGPSRFEGNSRATVMRGELKGAIGFGPIFELAAALRGQAAKGPLLNYDEFAVGNLTVGRGYDPGANTGDRAVAGSHEVRANLALGQNAKAQLYGFFDWVKLWNLDTSSTEANRTLKSVGGGVRMTLFNAMRLDLTYARPLDPPLLTGVNIKRAPDRFMFSLTSQIIPFGSRR